MRVLFSCPFCEGAGLNFSLPRSAFYKEMREKYRPDPDNLLTSHEPWPEVDGGCKFNSRSM